MSSFIHSDNLAILSEGFGKLKQDNCYNIYRYIVDNVRISKKEPSRSSCAVLTNKT